MNSYEQQAQALAEQCWTAVLNRKLEETIEEIICRELNLAQLLEDAAMLEECFREGSNLRITTYDNEEKDWNGEPLFDRAAIRNAMSKEDEK